MVVHQAMTSNSSLTVLLSRITGLSLLRTSRFSVSESRQLSYPILPSVRLQIPLAISLNVPGWIGDVWDSVLRAVPKKKTSHSKKRSRQRAGKALKDVTALSKCSGCGHVKRWHVLCPYCVKEIQDMWKGKGPLKKATTNKPDDS